jgi:hypothetical protein
LKSSRTLKRGTQKEDLLSAKKSSTKGIRQTFEGNYFKEQVLKS